MKKLFVALTLVAFSLGMSAQHVTPLNIKLTEFNLDTMRVAYANDPQMYATELQHIVLLQEEDAKAIKEAWKELKDENTHAKNLASCLKDVNKSVTTIEKSANNEIKIIKGMISTIEKQQKSNRSLAKLKAETRDEYDEYLSGEKRYLDSILESLSVRQKNLSDAKAGAQKMEVGLNAFVLEIKQKELDLKQLETTNKARVETIKAEQKIVKAMIKNK